MLYVFSYSEMMGEVGGGCGVNYRLFRENQKQGSPLNMVNVFKDTILTTTSDTKHLRYKTPQIQNTSDTKHLRYKTPQVQNTSGTKKISSAIKAILCLIFPWLRSVKLVLRKRNIQKFLETLNSKYHFSENDVYIFHDTATAEAFTSLYGYKSTALVYHQQGSLYGEWQAFTGKKSSCYHHSLLKLLSNAINNVQYICFPSEGSKKELMINEPALVPILENKKCRILYNGYSQKNFTDSLPFAEEKLKGKTVFTTVAALNQTKAVERIPAVLAEYMKHNDNFVWVLLGNGVMAGAIQNDIDYYGLKDKVIWVKEFLSHDAVLSVLKRTDYYILMHRRSIFDYATLEAMIFGAVLLLSSTGGNLEVLEEGSNGFFINGPEDIRKIFDIDDSRLHSMRENSIRIEHEKFSEEAFLKRYSDLVSEITENLSIQSAG